MSVKIYQAYRIKRQHCYWDVLMDIQTKARKRIKQTLRETYDNLFEHWTNDPKDFAVAYKSIWGDRPKELTRVFVRDFVSRSYAAQLGRSERDVFDLDVCVAVRRVNKRYLLIPFAGSGLLRECLNFLPKMPELEDYHYQNNSDRPSNVSPTEWRARRDTWETVLDEPKWSQMLVLDICSYGAFSKVDPFFEDVLKRAGKAKGKRLETMIKKELG